MRDAGVRDALTAPPRPAPRPLVPIVQNVGG